MLLATFKLCSFSSYFAFFVFNEHIITKVTCFPYVILILSFIQSVFALIAFICSIGSGVKHQNLIRQDSVKAKPKSTVSLSKPSGSSSFMKPTASHLAKQNKESDIHSGSYGRF